MSHFCWRTSAFLKYPNSACRALYLGSPCWVRSNQWKKKNRMICKNILATKKIKTAANGAYFTNAVVRKFESHGNQPWVNTDYEWFELMVRIWPLSWTDFLTPSFTKRFSEPLFIRGVLLRDLLQWGHVGQQPRRSGFWCPIHTFN